MSFRKRLPDILKKYRQPEQLLLEDLSSVGRGKKVWDTFEPLVTSELRSKHNCIISEDSIESSEPP